MDRRCLIVACEREAEIHCDHCSHDVCNNHYLEHKTLIHEQLPSFIDEMNLIHNRLRRNDKNESTSVPQYLIEVYDQLDKWRKDCHQHIDTVYDQVRHQIENIVETRKHDENQKAVEILESLEQLREQLNELLKEGDVTHIQLETMKNQLEKFKTKEQKSINHPDIRIVTEKIDVDKYISVIIEVNHLLDEQRNPKSTPTTHLNIVPSTQES